MAALDVSSLACHLLFCWGGRGGLGLSGLSSFAPPPSEAKRARPFPSRQLAGAAVGGLPLFPEPASVRLEILFLGGAACCWGVARAVGAPVIAV